MEKYDYLIVCAGLFGATFAWHATKAEKKCLVIDRRDHIGGNVYCEMVSGIHVHRYGPHIFHTSNKKVWEFVNRFVSFNRFTLNTKASYKGEIYSLPFNMNTFYEMWGTVTLGTDKGQQFTVSTRIVLVLFDDSEGSLIQGTGHLQGHGVVSSLVRYVCKHVAGQVVVGELQQISNSAAHHALENEDVALLLQSVYGACTFILRDFLLLFLGQGIPFRSEVSIGYGVPLLNVDIEGLTFVTLADLKPRKWAFINKFLHDAPFIERSEPFQIFHHGVVASHTNRPCLRAFLVDGGEPLITDKQMLVQDKVSQIDQDVIRQTFKVILKEVLCAMVSYTSNLSRRRFNTQ